jgi:hypothetical protein
MNKEILIDRKKRVAINQLRNAEDKAGESEQKKHLERKNEPLEKYYIHRKKKK